MYDFSVDYRAFDTCNIIDIHEYLMKKYGTCISISNEKCMIQPTLINLHPNEYSQEFYYCPFEVKLHRSSASYNTLNDLSNKVYVPNKREDLHLSVFNMIAVINKSKTLTKHIS